MSSHYHAKSQPKHTTELLYKEKPETASNNIYKQSQPDGKTMDDFLALLKKPEALGVALLAPQKVQGTISNYDDSDDPNPTRQTIQRTCQVLFRRVETLASLYKKHVQQQQQQQQQQEGAAGSITSLTGLQDLYLGGSRPDAEMLYGQVEAQNVALLKLVKSASKALCKSVQAGDKIQILQQEDSDEESEKDDEVDSDESDSESQEDGDNEQRRIRARMARAMDDMEEEEEEEEEADMMKQQNQKSEKDNDEESTSLEDPVANELNDGFFDINEMEAFADEEEEYLPDEAFGEEKPEEPLVKDKRSFHQKLRDGDLDDGSDNDGDLDEEEEESLLFRAESSIRRKRYRTNDEIEALYKLYEKPSTLFGADLDDDDDDDDDVINMTAADLFGKPKKKYYDKWQARNDASNTKLPTTKKAKSGEGDDDNGSWKDYDFGGGDEKDETAGWNDELNKGKKNDSDDDDDEEEQEGNVPDKESTIKPTEALPSKDQRQQKLLKQIEAIEKDLLSEKPWQMKGEVPGSARPVDSLLESTPEFEAAAKQAPIITVERTASLEEVIKKRILDEDWDDVVPRELPDVAWKQKKGELPEVSQEKSKLGLGELYEREYLKKVAGYDADASEKETEAEKAKNEMKTLFANLCSKLDALSNYHFAPRPIAEEAEIRAVTKPAIAMEEVLPLHVSDARAVAPEQVYEKKRGREGVLRGESELQQPDRKRLRSAKKAARRKARQEKLADEKLLSRLQPGLGLNNPYEKRKMREQLSAARARGKITTGQADTNSYGKSTTFFQRMQADAKQTIRGGTATEQEGGNNSSSSKTNKKGRDGSSGALKL